MTEVKQRLDQFNKKGSRGNREPFFESYSSKRPEIAAPNSRLSAVSLIIYDINGTPTFPLILRSTYDGVHSGQIALPGGKHDHMDSDLIETAIRESQEEIGVSLNREMYQQDLKPIYIPPSHMHVHPYYFTYKERPELIKNEREVQDVIEVPLLDFLNTRPQYTQVSVGESTLKVPSYIINGHVVWGATALILSEFKENLK